MTAPDGWLRAVASLYRYVDMSVPTATRVAYRWLRQAGLSKVYYHGTPSEKAGQSILRSGILPPDLSTRKEDAFRPVGGRVYLTPKLSWAMLYALGGELADAFLSGRAGSERLWKGSEWGYLFVVPGSALQEVHPDEDYVGEILADGTAPRWLQSLAEHALVGKLPEVMPDVPDTFYVPDFFSWGEWQTWRAENDLYTLATRDGFFSLKAQAVAGKLLLELMTPEQELELISMGGHVAHQGKVTPSACWKIHKSNVSKLQRDGSNFFQVAERCR